MFQEDVWNFIKTRNIRTAIKNGNKLNQQFSSHKKLLSSFFFASKTTLGY